MLKKTAGTFAATGMSETVIGEGVSFYLSFAGTATVQIEFWSPAGAGGWIVARTAYTATPASPPIQIADRNVRSWRLNCTAHTNDVIYDLMAG